MTAWGYEYYRLVLKVSLTSEQSEAKIKFVSPRGHAISSICFIFKFLLGKRLSMLLVILSCRMESTAYYRNISFSNSQATLHSFSERCETCHIAFYPMICLRSFRWMTAHLVWFIGSQRENYVKWNLRPLLVFVMIHRFLSSVALSTMQFTTFFLDGGSYFFSVVNKVDFTCR